MRLIFAGTPEFAATALSALLDAGHTVALVLTQPDRPAGRGMQQRPSAAKRVAVAHRLPLLQPPTLKDENVARELRSAGTDAMVVAAYGLLLPATVLAIPARGCINIHASLLPRWRGAAPIQRALLAGDVETGITIMQMDAGLDTGAILLQERLAITPEDTAHTLYDKLAALGARCVVRVLGENPAPRAQDPTLATYADKIAKAEAAIDWAQTADAICRKVRAFNPHPGASTTFARDTLKIWCARPGPTAAGTPGTVVGAAANGIMVAAGSGTVCITELQRAGGKRLGAAPFLAGFALAPGARLGG